MKKCFSILIAAMLLLLPLAAWAEGTATSVPEALTAEPTPEAVDPTPPPLPPEPEHEPLPERYLPLERRALGEWYAEYEGFLFILTFTEDGVYTLSAPGTEPQTGKWEVKDGMVVLDGEEAQALLPVNGVLRSDALGLLFTREKPETYVPAEVLADAKEGSFDGFWKAQFVAVGDGVILAQALREDAIVYIEGTNVALGGKRFGDVIRVFTASDGALTLTEGESTVSLQLQQDGFLRLTVAGPDPVTIYLLASPIPGQTPPQEP